MGELLPLHAPRDRPEPRSAPAPSDEALVSAVLAGSGSARESLFRRHYPRVLQLAYRLLGREDDAEDLAQDVCVIALGDLHKLREPQAFGGWLTRICVLRARSRVRHYKVLRRLHLVPGRTVDPDQVIAADAPQEVAAELRSLYGQLHALPTDTQLALVLRRVEGRSIEDIAELMDCSPATVKRRVADGHRRLANRASHDRGAP